MGYGETLPGRSALKNGSKRHPTANRQTAGRHAGSTAHGIRRAATRMFGTQAEAPAPTHNITKRSGRSERIIRSATCDSGAVFDVLFTAFFHLFFLFSASSALFRPKIWWGGNSLILPPESGRLSRRREFRPLRSGAARRRKTSNRFLPFPARHSPDECGPASGSSEPRLLFASLPAPAISGRSPDCLRPDETVPLREVEPEKQSAAYETLTPYRPPKCTECRHDAAAGTGETGTDPCRSARMRRAAHAPGRRRPCPAFRAPRITRSKQNACGTGNPNTLNP